MVLAFTETEKQKIESAGISVIEFKRMVYELWKVIDKAIQAIKDFMERFIKAYKVIINTLHEHMKKYKDFYLYMAEITEETDASQQTNHRTKGRIYQAKN